MAVSRRRQQRLPAGPPPSPLFPRSFSPGSRWISKPAGSCSSIPAMAFGRPVAFDHRPSIAIQSFNAALEYQQQGGVKPRAVQGAGARRFGWMVSWVCERAPRVDQGVGIGRLGRAALIPIHALRQILHLAPLRPARDRRPFNPSSERTPGPSPGCSVRRGRQGRWRPCGPVRGPRCRQRRNTPRPCACWGGIRSWSC